MAAFPSVIDGGCATPEDGGDDMNEMDGDEVEADDEDDAGVADDDAPAFVPVAVPPALASQSRYRRSAAKQSGSIQLCCLRIVSSSGAHAMPPRRAARDSV